MDDEIKETVVRERNLVLRTESGLLRSLINEGGAALVDDVLPPRQSVVSLPHPFEHENVPPVDVWEVEDAPDAPSAVPVVLHEAKRPRSPDPTIEPPAKVHVRADLLPEAVANLTPVHAVGVGGVLPGISISGPGGAMRLASPPGSYRYSFREGLDLEIGVWWRHEIADNHKRLTSSLIRTYSHRDYANTYVYRLNQSLMPSDYHLQGTSSGFSQQPLVSHHNYLIPFYIESLDRDDYNPLRVEYRGCCRDYISPISRKGTSKTPVGVKAVRQCDLFLNKIYHKEQLIQHQVLLCDFNGDHFTICLAFRFLKKFRGCPLVIERVFSFLTKREGETMGGLLIPLNAEIRQEFLRASVIHDRSRVPKISFTYPLLRQAFLMNVLKNHCTRRKADQRFICEIIDLQFQKIHAALQTVHQSATKIALDIPEPRLLNRLAHWDAWNLLYAYRRLCCSHVVTLETYRTYNRRPHHNSPLRFELIFDILAFAAYPIFIDPVAEKRHTGIQAIILDSGMELPDVPRWEVYREVGSRDMWEKLCKWRNNANIDLRTHDATQTDLAWHHIQENQDLAKRFRLDHFKHVMALSFEDGPAICRVVGINRIALLEKLTEAEYVEYKEGNETGHFEVYTQEEERNLQLMCEESDTDMSC